MMPIKYTTRADAIYLEIVEPIQASGVVADAYAEYDVDEIADELLIWDDAYDAETRTINLNQQGYYIRKEEEPGEFWDVVAAHEVEQ